MKELDGKVAIVTGAASGMGRASCVALAERGATVVGVDVDMVAADDVLAEIGERGRFKRLDVTDSKNWDALVTETVDEFAALHILVNCAGILRPGSIETISMEDWRRTMAVNVDGIVFGCRAAVRAMRKNRSGGSIVNIASTSSMYADADLVAYDSSKGAVCSLTKEVAVYCAKKGYRIRCNSIHPGTIKTPMLDRFFAENDIPDELHDSWMHDIPLGRSGTPDEVGHLVAFLASDRSSFMTGSECVIDGGVTA